MTIILEKIGAELFLSGHCTEYLYLRGILHMLLYGFGILFKSKHFACLPFPLARNVASLVKTKRSAKLSFSNDAAYQHNIQNAFVFPCHSDIATPALCMESFSVSFSKFF
ncbi:hypothetical protein NPIL_441221 [Nephila pilipes]|uniref:Uncharacterized protein n=1 Tax=Nephila pilipes TaxID=299642 RepID=A0A8X6P4W2_NEPPI|nr:hypothetical protein NPIL_441221 [Nephila pilipes]